MAADSFKRAIGGLLTIVIFVAMVFYYFEKPSEIFMKYYALMSFSLAVLSIAFVGIPYIRESDTVSPSKSFYLSISGLAITFLFGALVVFLTDITPENYITIASMLTMVIVYSSTLIGTKETVEISPFMKSLMSILLLGILFVAIGYSAPFLSARFPKFAGVIKLIEIAMPATMWGLATYGAYIGLKELVILSRPPAKAASAIPYYEPYQDAPGVPTSTGTKETAPEESEIVRMTKAVRNAIASLEQDLEILTEQGESTCSIVRDVETGYVGAKSAPESEDEYSLPKDEMNARKEKRQLRAMNAFRNNRKLFSSLRSSHPMLECFADPPPSNPEEDDLREAVQELQAMMENTDVVAGINKADQIHIALAFSEKILDRGDKDGFQDATGPAAGPSTLHVSTLTGPELLTAARDAIKRADAVHDQVRRNQLTLATLQERVNKQIRKGSMVARGDYSGKGVLGPSSGATA
jgi:hypothetical protein